MVACPRCTHELREITVEAQNDDGEREDVPVEECAACHGLWLDREKLSQLENVTKVVLVELRRLPGEETQERLIQCPKCADRHVMEKIESQEDSTVIMDVCSQCQGVWLDDGELEAIQNIGLLPFLARLANWMRE
jgi:Zn-finger nucleic acid-binding protein